VDEQNQVLGQHDGLDVPVVGWQAGDIILQRHVLAIASDVSEGRFWLQVGLYNPRTLQRVSVVNEKGTVIGDRLLIRPVIVE